jgi:hypothetical protein
LNEAVADDPALNVVVDTLKPFAKLIEEVDASSALVSAVSALVSANSAAI